MKTKKTVFFTMVNHPINGWIRVGNAYQDRSTAKSWTSFVCKAWRGLKTKVVSCVLHFEDDKLSEKSKKVLSEKFNMDPPK